VSDSDDIERFIKERGVTRCPTRFSAESRQADLVIEAGPAPPVPKAQRWNGFNFRKRKKVDSNPPS